MKVLVAGIGNIFNQDDGFGVEVARQLVDQPWPPGVRVEDYGIRGVHLALELLEGYDLLVLVDAVPSAEPPGTVFLFEPDAPGEDAASADGGPSAGPLDAHRMDPQAVLAMVASLGGEVGRVLVVGCQPAEIDEGIGLSPPVLAAVGPAVRMVQDVIAERSTSCVA